MLKSTSQEEPPMSDELQSLADPVYVIPVSVLGRPEVEFIHHAFDRMRQRRASVEQVIDVLLAPDEENLPADPPYLRVRKWVTEEEALDVIFLLLPAKVRVISTFWTKVNISKRL